MMRFRGYVCKNGKDWLAEIPSLEVHAQGKTKKEALEMICDLVEGLVDKEGFVAEVHAAKGDQFEVGPGGRQSSCRTASPEKRELSGLSLAEAAERPGIASRNAYARYEQGKAAPTVEKLCQLLRAVSPEKDLVLG